VVWEADVFVEDVDVEPGRVDTAAGDLLVERKGRVASGDHQPPGPFVADPADQEFRGVSRGVSGIVADLDVHVPITSRPFIDGPGGGP
jgi:hypothetical protein